MDEAPSQQAGSAHPGEDAFGRIVTGDAAMRRIFGYLTAVARSGEPILITGETGTGKDLVARAAHALSGRAGAYVAVHVGGLEERDGALFGDGAQGPLQRAAGGTLFLDEIGDLGPSSQVRLLRLIHGSDLQDDEPRGSEHAPRCDARLIAATGRDPRELLDRDGFRGDLFYRLRTHHVHLPPLRERRGDLTLLLEHFAGEAAAALRRARPSVPAELVRLLDGHPFPGNVRELRALVFDAVSRGADGRLPFEPFRQALAEHGLDGRARGDRVAFPSVLPSLREVQDLLVAEALRRSDGNQALAASWLGITRQGLNKRLRGRPAPERSANA
jgi:DNA-binding NtrC family response regulator